MLKLLAHKRLLRTLLFLQGFWLAVILASLAFNISSARQDMLTTAEAAAQATISRDLSIRNWAADKGGVYIPPTDTTPPNPYLQHPRRDLTTQEGLELTLINPAYMMRDLQEQAPDLYGVQTRLISLNPLNPVNQADTWEAAALQEFAQKLDPISTVADFEGQPHLRKIQPFVVDPSCMSCHAHQGYQIGEIRGGISSTVPLAPYLARYASRKNELYLTHLGVWFLGFVGLSAGFFREREKEKQRHRYEQQLELAAEVFDNSYEGILITDAQARIVNANQAFERISGYSKEELLGKNPRILNSGRQSPEVYQAMWQALNEQGHWEGEFWNRNKSGEIYAVNLTISALYDDEQPRQVRNYLALISDITRLKDNETKLERLAHYDILTCLPNRLLLIERLQQAILDVDNNRHFLAVALLDLDGFKSINEQHGHEIGDRFLLELTRRLVAQAKGSDILARVGGDEFVLVLNPLVCKSDSEPLLNELLQVIADTYIVDDLVLQVTASIGVTFYPTDSADAEQLLRHADQAMAIAKQEGKNCISFFDPQEDKSLRYLYAQGKEVEKALQQGELVLYYQPKIHSGNHQIIGAEALIRWQHPVKGLLAPGQFLPIIQNHPVMLEVGRWVMQAALQQLDAWQAANIQCPLSINLHSAQIQEEGFLDELQELLDGYPQVNPASLEIEVLETTAVVDMLTVSRALQGIRKLGVQISIDDFGTGYSSLSYLKHLPVNTLKIDQSFVRDLLDDSDDLAIVQGVISMAAAFKLKVIAEGVETRLHSVKLMELGCVQVQGYGVSRPLPAEDFILWREGWLKEPLWLQ
ncbi:PAS domain S-box-containing protein/diguanylate cyclase (GGDEF) domain-containing protein [Marinospirillum celere]|uniref:PAS domain S-box-containing protein/diguanylate cyclase (GGDEF) domain-containing protein n=1 Tax=Marinospirillum celere TaxID=1122252 RepID=A0A1I1DW66_9GAMM|nr:EAL domain-containing protein [Marinospirillum celere]SFB79299.1 PAS domain S-box-containing protein/diguanylate cyclase (GGDEF) domain-containing protein [Marinospirillum celere]